MSQARASMLLRRVAPISRVVPGVQYRQVRVSAQTVHSAAAHRSIPASAAVILPSAAVTLASAGFRVTGSDAGVAASALAGDLVSDSDGAWAGVHIGDTRTHILIRRITPMATGVIRRGLLRQIIRRHIPVRAMTTTRPTFTRACPTPIRLPKTISTRIRLQATARTRLQTIRRA